MCCEMCWSLHKHNSRLRGCVAVPERAVHELSHVTQLPPHGTLPLHLQSATRTERHAIEPASE